MSMSDVGQIGQVFYNTNWWQSSSKWVPSPYIELRARRSVHRALAVDELLRMITLQLRGESSSLLALATTCKAWSAVSLEALWVEITSRQLARIYLMREQCLASEGPDIYTEHLHKVQVLVNKSANDANDALAELPTFKPRTIICLDSSQPVETSFLRPHVSNLIFAHDRGIWDKKWLSSFTRDLHTVSLSLKVLEIALIPRESSMEVLRRLADLQVLQRLKIQLTDDCAHTWMQPISLRDDVTCSEKGLQALEDLDIEAPITIVETMLAFTGSKLRKLRITGAPFDSASMISRLFTKITEVPWATQLTHLRYGVSNRWSIVGDWEDSLNEWGIARLEHETILFTSQHLHPLLQLSSLSHLTLAFHARPRINDLFLASLASKLSLLQNLSISGRDHDDPSYPLTTLGGMLSLARLPSLSALQLPLDLRFDDTAGAPVVEQYFQSLTRLCVSDSLAPTAPCTVAAVLVAAFPHLRKVYIAQSVYEDSHRGAWCSIWNTWKGCQRDAGSLEIEVVEPDFTNEQGAEEDFFLAAVKDAIGIDQSEDGSVGYLTCPVDMTEYYTRFPESRRNSLITDDIMHAIPQRLST